MSEPLHPSLYQINTRVWLTELSHVAGRAATLDDIPDAELDRLAKLGFDWIGLLSVCRSGSAWQQVTVHLELGGDAALGRCASACTRLDCD